MIEEGRGRRLNQFKSLAARFGFAASLILGTPALAEPGVTEVRINRHEALTRVSVGMSQPVQFRAYVLGAPYRVIVDLPAVDWHLGKEARLNGAPITAWRFGSFSKEVMRIVFDLDRPVRIQKSFALPPK